MSSYETILKDAATAVNATYDRAYKQGMEHAIRIIKLYEQKENGITLAIGKLEKLIKEVDHA